MKKFGVLLSLLMLVIVGCSGGGGNTAAPEGSTPDSAATDGSTSSGGNSSGTKVLSSIAVSPKNSTVTVVAGDSMPFVQFVATGTYSDNTTQDITASVTWKSSEPSIATIGDDASMKGKATTVAAGTTIITAVSGNISGETNLYVKILNPLTDVSLGGGVEHHIGDGRWGNETANSQLSQNDGIKNTYTETFSLKDQPQNFPNATITLQHRGIEASQGYNDALIINSHSYPLADSHADGSYTPFSLKLPSDIFVSNGTNTIIFQSGNVTWDLTDYDDFEFQQILLQFGN